VGTLKGEYQYSLDEKGRVVIPPKFRHVLGDQVVATRGFGTYIGVYSPTAWSRVEEGVQRLSVAQQDVLRFVLASAVDLDVDRQGRIMLPPYLREHAKISREVVVVGLSSRVEIWGRSIWKTYLTKAQRSAPKLAEQIPELRI
jgi:MraZ protein